MNELEGAERSEPKFEQYEVLTMFGRYGGAWQEYNARIAARHQLINMWLTVSAAALAGFASTQWAGGITVSTPITLVIGIALPCIAWAMFQMLFLHDVMLGRLSKFMQACEAFNNEYRSVTTSSRGPLPSYHLEEKFGKGIVRTRWIQNFTLRLAAWSIAVAQLSIVVFVHLRLSILTIVGDFATMTFDISKWMGDKHAEWPGLHLISVVAYIYVWSLADRANMNGITIRIDDDDLKSHDDRVRMAFLRTVPKPIRPIVREWIPQEITVITAPTKPA